MVARSLMVPCHLCLETFAISEDEYQSEFPPICPDCIADLDDAVLPWSDDTEGRWLVEMFAPPACDDPEPWEQTAPDDVRY